MAVVRIEDVAQAVADVFGVSLSDLRSGRRDHQITVPRQTAFLLAREMTGASFPQIGRWFGGRDHTTVVHGVRRVRDHHVQPQIEAARDLVMRRTTNVFLRGAAPMFRSVRAGGAG